LRGLQIGDQALEPEVEQLHALDAAKAAMPIGEPLPGDRAEHGNDRAHQRDGNERLQKREAGTPGAFLSRRPARPHGPALLTRRIVSKRSNAPDGLSTRTITSCGDQTVFAEATKSAGYGAASTRQR
jgi:hypothetical protein